MNIYVVGNKHMEQSRSCLNVSQQPISLKEEQSTPQFVLSVPYVSASDTNGQKNGQVVVTGTNLQPALPMANQFHGIRGALYNGVELSGDTQIRYAKSGLDARGRLSRYWPRFTDKELQQISGEYPLIRYLVSSFFIFLFFSMYIYCVVYALPIIAVVMYVV